MSLSDLLKSISEKDDRAGADVLAVVMNADAYARQHLAGRNILTGGDVLRLGRVLTEYADLTPAPEGAEAYRKPSASNVRPVVPGPAEQAA